MKNKDRDRRTLETIIDLLCKYEPDIIEEYGGLYEFVNWIRNLNIKKLYRRLK